MPGGRRRRSGRGGTGNATDAIVAEEEARTAALEAEGAWPRLGPAAAEAAVQAWRHTALPAARVATPGVSAGWRFVLPHIIADFTQDWESGYCTASVVGRRLARLAATCRELRGLVLAEGYPRLAPLVPARAFTDYFRLAAPMHLTDVWLRFYSDPAGCSLADVQALANRVRITDSTHLFPEATQLTRAQMVLRLLHYQGLAAPSRVPPQIVMAVAKEKHDTADRGYAMAMLEKLYRRYPGWRPRMMLSDVPRMFNLRWLLEKVLRLRTEAEWRAVRDAYLAEAIP